MGGHNYRTGVGPLVTAGAGSGGFRVAGGVGALETMGPGLATGLDLQLVISRTTDGPRHASSQSTYIGAEGGLVITSVRFSLGFAHRIGGSAAELRNILTWSVGVQIPIGRW